MVLLFVIYVVTAKLGLALDAVSGFATLVWPPSGIALVAMVLYGRRLWPAIVLGALVVNLTAGAPVSVALGIATGNALEAAVGASILAWLRFDPAIRRLRDVIVLTLGAAVASTAISASIGATSLWLGDMIAPSALVSTWRAWWIGDALGNLIVAPTLLVWGARDTIVPPVEGGDWCEALADARLVVLPRAGHVPMIDAADELADVIVAFREKPLDELGDLPGV